MDFLQIELLSNYQTFTKIQVQSHYYKETSDHDQYVWATMVKIQNTLPFLSGGFILDTDRLVSFV